MAFCSNCGTQVEEGIKFCPSCGSAMSVESATNNTNSTNNTTGNATSSTGGLEDKVSEKFNQFNDTADTTSEYTTSDIEQNKKMAILAYLGFLVLIPIFTAKESKFLHFHANQGLVLCIASIAWNVAISIVTMILPFLSGLLSLVSYLGGILIFVIMIIGIINAVNGKAKELPLIGKFRILK